MSFNSINSFFDRFKKITRPNETVRKIASDILFETIGVKINISQIDMERENLRIKSNGFIKSEIFLHKEQILQSLKEKLGDQAPQNIL